MTNQNEQITEQLWEEVVLQYPEVSNAEYHATKVGNHEFAKVCNDWLEAKLNEKLNNLPDADREYDDSVTPDDNV